MARKQTNKLTLESEKVKAYISFVAAREMGLLRKLYPENVQNEKQFCITIGLSEKSSKALHNYTKIDGFEAALDKQKTKNKRHLLEIGMSGLTALSQKMKLKREVLDTHGDVRELEVEIEPNVKACEDIVKLGGGMLVDTLHIESEDVTEIKAAAERSRLADKAAAK